jgi:SHS2 domain-containing protein
MKEHHPYAALDHPADLFLEIRGPDVPSLFSNALFALYDQMAALDGFQRREHMAIEAEGADLAETLRALLAEALYHFADKGFVATESTVAIEETENGTVRAIARLHGERLDRLRHTLLSEVKAVTYHRLSAGPTPGGDWRATVLLDI